MPKEGYSNISLSINHAIPHFYDEFDLLHLKDGLPWKQNDLLVDPVARTVIPRRQSHLASRARSLCQGRPRPHAGSGKHCTNPISSCNQDRSEHLPRVITRCYTIRLACCAIAMEDTHYKELNTAFMKQYSDVFSKTLSSRLPPEGGPKHRIILKDDRPINGRLMRVPIRYWPVMKRFVDTNLNAKRIRPSSSHISAGTLMTPKKDITADPRVVHDYVYHRPQNSRRYPKIIS